MARKSDGDAPALTLSKSTLAGLAALLTLLQGTIQFYVTQAMQPQIDDFQSQMATLVETVQADKTQHQRLLGAILTYQIESDRYLREAVGPGHPRPLELDAAAARIRELSAASSPLPARTVRY